MEYRKLGDSGLKVSLAGLGCNNFGMRIDAEATRAVVHRALDEGVTFFDTADIYGFNPGFPLASLSNRGGSEEMLGRALGNRRHEVIVASKFGLPMGDGPYKNGATRGYIMAAAEASLKRLYTDYQLTSRTLRHRRRKRLRRSTISCARAKSDISTTAISADGKSLMRTGSRALAAARVTCRRRTSTTCWIEESNARFCRPARNLDWAYCPITRSPAGS